MKRLFIAAAAGIVAAGAVTASAASLGGVNSNSAGADSAAVATCDSDGIDVDYTMVYSSSSSAYHVDTVELTGVDGACDTLDYYLTISGTGGTALADDTGTVALSGDAMSIDVSAANVDAEAVLNVAIAIVSN